MITLKGSYVLKTKNQVIKSGSNLITFLGESFFLNRAVNNEFDPMKYIVFGNSSLNAKKSDISLGNETVRKRCVSEVDLDTKQIILKCSCTTSEILNTTEIGVANDLILISHDIYEAIDSSYLPENIDTIEVTYTFDLATSSTRGNWEHYTSINTGNTDYNIYYTAEENEVVGVTEDNTKSGYRKVASLNSLKSVNGGYYYDNSMNYLFIRTIKHDNPNREGYKIVISTR